MSLSNYFAASYAQARANFLAAASVAVGPAGALESHLLPGHLGAQGEPLAMDVARLGPGGAKFLLVVTSGVHGAEGFCGSGCQVALLHDDDLRQRLARADVALLLVHAVNPFGFSHLRRVNEGNVDLNRNFLAFDVPRPANERYGEVHGLAVPEQWPPDEANRTAIARYVQQHGMRAYESALMTGQGSHADGLFYCGAAPAWSNLTLRDVLRRHGAGCQRVHWIDIHTGLGPVGHGEKIHAGRNDPADLARARACWGADVFSPHAGDSYAQPVQGNACSAVHDECPQALAAAIGMEFGTVALSTMIDAVRADQWLAAHPQAPRAQHEQIRGEVKSAFYVDTDEWRGSVCGQTRVAVLQSCVALSS